MRSPALLAFGFVAASLTLAGPSRADFTKSESFEGSAKTSLKIVEPTGAKAVITINGETKEEALPAIFALPEADAFVSVKIVAADGETWNGKVEIKAHKQTVLKLAQTAKPAAAAAPAAKVIGKVNNATQTCSNRRARQTLKFTFMKDGKEAISLTVPQHQAMFGVNLEPGSYSVRVFTADGTFMQAVPFEITKDGWLFNFSSCGG